MLEEILKNLGKDRTFLKIQYRVLLQGFAFKNENVFYVSLGQLQERYGITLFNFYFQSNKSLIISFIK